MADGFMSMPTFTPRVSSGSAELSLPIKDDGALSEYVEACADLGSLPAPRWGNGSLVCTSKLRRTRMRWLNGLRPTCCTSLTRTQSGWRKPV